MSPAAAAALGQRAGSRRRLPGPLLILLGVGGLVVAAFASLALGASTIAPADVVSALLAFDGSSQHVAVAEVRLPRTIVALAVAPRWVSPVR